MHIPFVGEVKFEFLAYFPMDHLAHPVVSSLVLFLSQFAVFTYYMWSMVSSLSPHNLHFLLCYVLSILALIWLVLLALFYVAIRRDSVSLLKFPSSHVKVLSCEMLFISRLKRPWSFFLPIFVSDGRYQSPFVFLYIVFESLYGCVNAVFDARNSSSSIFSWFIYSVHVVFGM